MSAPDHADSAKPRRRRVYVPAVGPRLKKLLYFIFGLLALLGANSAYLVAITALEWFTGNTYQSPFYLLMFLGHLVLGLVLIVPFLIFATIHIKNARKRKNRRAVRVGYALFFVFLLILASGVLLMRVGGFDLKNPEVRSLVYWMHVITPLVAGWLYWLHRLAGAPIKWRIGLGYLGVVGTAVVLMIGLHSEDPRKWNVVGPEEGAEYFHPSLARTLTGQFIPAKSLMMDEYCLKCHEDIHAGWKDSVHHFSSFNNPAYLASITETREVMLERDGSVKSSRWCAGCHDPVPFFSGAFDDPEFDMLHDPTASAGITCTVCHAITSVNSSQGNADYTIEEPMHYPFAYSDNSILQWINNQLVKAKPALHKKTFLKPLHKTSEFCAACHKVHLPEEVTRYKEFLRGQNHYDSFLLSGVSGHGARSFYYPPVAETNCNGCHMPLEASDDFGARRFDGSDALQIHDHLFPSANTAMAWLRDRDQIIEAHREFNEGVMRVDIFGVRDGGTLDGELHAPLRPDVPTLKPGHSYLLETVIRTLRMGHHFSQGTADSNEIWLDVTVRSGDRVIGRSGGLDEANANQVDPWSHFVNVFMLDKNGDRIDRRNAQDIVVPLYNHQIPPGAAQTVHYRLDLPPDLTAPVTVDVKLQYRKFDSTYMDFVARHGQPGGQPIRGYQPGEPWHNELPVMTLAEDTVTFPVEGVDIAVDPQPPHIGETWQRWNDYGIGSFLKGKAELRQAGDAFRKVEQLGRYDGPLNLARVLLREAGSGQLDEAVDALERAGRFEDPPPPSWTLNWLNGLANMQQGRFREAEANFRSVLDTRIPERNLDFSKDYVVINLLGETLFERAKQQRGEANAETRDALLQEAIGQFHKTLEMDSENVTAHYNLGLLYGLTDDQEKSAWHRDRHEAYKPDDTIRGRVVGLARQQYPAANASAEPVVIYDLQRPGAPGLSNADEPAAGKTGKQKTDGAEEGAE